MPPKKAAVTAVKEAATFDAATWLDELAARGFKPRNVTVKMHIRGDLIPRIQRLVEQLQANDDVELETGVNDVDALAGVRAEYERLNREFEAGGSLEFTFRPMNKRIHNATLAEWNEAYPGDDHTEDEFSELVMLRMAATCITYPGDRGAPITAEGFRAFEEAYGTPAFNTLAAGFVEAYNSGGEVSAPFSPNASPTPDTDGSSSI